MNIVSHEWWRTGVVYQVYSRSVQDSDGDGTGNVAGAIERLPHEGIVIVP